VEAFGSSEQRDCSLSTYPWHGYDPLYGLGVGVGQERRDAKLDFVDLPLYAAAEPAHHRQHPGIVYGRKGDSLHLIMYGRKLSLQMLHIAVHLLDAYVMFRRRSPYRTIHTACILHQQFRIGLVGLRAAHRRPGEILYRQRIQYRHTNPALVNSQGKSEMVNPSGLHDAAAGVVERGDEFRDGFPVVVVDLVTIDRRRRTDADIEFRFRDVDSDNFCYICHTHLIYFFCRRLFVCSFDSDAGSQA